MRVAIRVFVAIVLIVTAASRVAVPGTVERIRNSSREKRRGVG
jgi:hypothetical protein